MTSGASATRFPPPGENDGYCLEWTDPHRVFPVGAPWLWGL